ncbi:hypothetical protein OG21DRAFT_1176621 [Imleria badia]|nr:hypothetical protein OG21DRAFT_1176621 [Imleria badia]
MDPEVGAMHKGALLDACGSLVTYNEDTGILILSHFSVKEYLTGDLTRSKLPQYHISYQDAHEHLARSCICYLTLYLKHVHGSDGKTEQSMTGLVAAQRSGVIFRGLLWLCSQCRRNSSVTCSLTRSTTWRISGQQIVLF